MIELITVTRNVVQVTLALAWTIPGGGGVHLNFSMNGRELTTGKTLIFNHLRERERMFSSYRLRTL